MPVEIDETELSAKNRVVGFVNQALANPKTRARVLEIQKELDPSFTAPELETRGYVDSQIGELKSTVTSFVDELRAEREAEKQKRETEALEAKWAEGREKIKQTPGVTDEYVGHVEEFMHKNGIIDHGIALAAFEKMNPLPQPIANGDNRWGFFDMQAGSTDASPDLKILFEGTDNGEAWLRQQIPATLAEVRGQRR